MSRLLAVTVCLLAVLCQCAGANADSIYGKCVYKDGSKAGSAVRISTSWNSKTAYPVNGRYVLDFGRKMNRSITVYVNGNTFGRVYVSKQTRLDIVVP